LQKRNIFVGLALLAMVVLAGCGSGGDTSSAVSKKQFLARGNALCKKTEEEEGRRFTKAQENSPSGNVSAARRNKVLTWIFVEPYERMIVKFKKFEVPDGDESKVEAIIQAMEEAKKKVEANPTQVLTSTAMYEGANKLLTQYGLESCVV
jgi:hypothetical protein